MIVRTLRPSTKYSCCIFYVDRVALKYNLQTDVLVYRTKWQMMLLKRRALQSGAVGIATIGLRNHQSLRSNDLVASLKCTTKLAPIKMYNLNGTLE